MSRGRAAARLVAGAAALAAFGSISLVLWVRRRLPVGPSEQQVESVINLRIGRFGVQSQHLYVGTSQGRIHLLVAGDGDRTVMLLPGLGASAGSYPGLIANLSRTCRVIALDLPGTGLSDPIQFAGHPRAAWTELIREVADQLGLATFHLCGHSLGGLAAGAFAVDSPQRVSSLVLLAPVGLAAYPPPIWRAALLPGLADVMFSLDLLLMRRQSARGAADVRGLARGPVEVGPDSDGYRFMVTSRFTTGFDLLAFRRLLEPSGFRADSLLLPALGLLSGRVMVVFGDQDVKVPLAPAERQLQNYPGLELRVVSGWNHLFPFVKPFETAELMEGWFGDREHRGRSHTQIWQRGSTLSSP